MLLTNFLQIIAGFAIFLAIRNTQFTRPKLGLLLALGIAWYTNWWLILISAAAFLFVEGWLLAAIHSNDASTS